MENSTWEKVTTQTALIGIGFTCCDTVTQLRHTGMWSRVRKGTVGRFPNKGEFRTTCNKTLNVLPHDCNHHFSMCPECEQKESK